jgi:chromosome segregation ATPase
MKVKHRILVGTALAACLLQARPPLDAQTERSGGETQKFMQQYQQLSAEKTALQAQLAQMKKDLDAAGAELATVKKERDAAKAHQGIPPTELAQANTAKETAEKSLEKSKQQVAEIVGKFREMAANLRDVEASRAQLDKELTERNGQIDKCADDNMQLFSIMNDVLDRYEHVGLFTKASASEPFTKITRTRIENVADEYRERAEQARVKQAKSTTAAPASGGAVPAVPTTQPAPSPTGAPAAPK